MQVYLVGGAVRDQLLGIYNKHTEKDYVVVGSSEAEMLRLGYKKVGKGFPVFFHPKTRAEYALARLESKVGAGYKGFEFNVSSDITLEQDLARRDLTINAIAKDKDGNLIDPFNGKKDLDNRVLKHVSAYFIDDPVRVLRVARFAAKFSSYGFKVVAKTKSLMFDMAKTGKLDALTSERIFKELHNVLSYKTPSVFFEVLVTCGALLKVFPALENSVIVQNNEFCFLDNINNDVSIKFCICLINENATIINNFCEAIKCPKKYQHLALLAAAYFVFVKSFIKQNEEDIFNFFIKTDALRRKVRFYDLLTVFELLGVDKKVIISLRDKLSIVNTSGLSKSNIKQAIYEQRILTIRSFLDSTK